MMINIHKVEIELPSVSAFMLYNDFGFWIINIRINITLIGILVNISDQVHMWYQSKNRL